MPQVNKRLAQAAGGRTAGIRINPAHSKCKQRRPALKKNTTTPARPKKTRQTASAKAAAKLTVGIDLGDQNSAYCVLDAEGDVLSEGTLRTSERGFAQQFESMSPCRMALETGTHSPWVSRLLQEYGHDVIVANARQVRVIYESDSKNDRVDARTLARLARIDKDSLHPIRHRSEKAQADLAMLRARDALVQVRTKLMNCVRGMVKSVGGRLPGASVNASPSECENMFRLRSRML